MMDSMLWLFIFLFGLLFVVSWYMNKEREKEKMKGVPYPGFEESGLNSSQWGKLSDEEKRVVWKLIRMGK